MVPPSRIDCGGFYRLRHMRTHYKPCAMGGGVNGCQGLLSAANPKNHHYYFLSMDFPPTPPVCSHSSQGLYRSADIKVCDVNRARWAAGSDTGGGSCPPHSNTSSPSTPHARKDPHSLTTTLSPCRRALPQSGAVSVGGHQVGDINRTRWAAGSATGRGNSPKALPGLKKLASEASRRV